VFLGAVLFTAGCGPAWRPKQARFEVTGCEAMAGVPAPETWRWSAEAEPVLTPGPAGAWDSVDALNPSVVWVSGVLYNFYSGFDGRAWRTGLATSTDGRRWEKAAAPVLSPAPETWEGDYIAANGSALHNGIQFVYWYQAGRPARIGLARSPDGRQWRKHPTPVLEPGPRGTWDEEAVADPYVIRCGRIYYMYFLGQNRRGLQRLGLARSTDLIQWQKHQSNPLLDTGGPGTFDERGLGEPAVFRAAGEFYMIYTGRDHAENRRLGAARSGDGVRWRRAPLAAPISGDRLWNARVVCDPTVLVWGGRLLMWFGGGDVASPDENLHGRIGLATLALQ